MTLRTFQAGLTPIGQFDFKDSEISAVRGGEMVVFDHPEVGVEDEFTSDVYSDTTRTQLRIATDTDTGPFFIVDADRNTGGLSEVALESTSLYASAAPHVRTVNSSGKFAIYAAEGFYSITSDVIDNATIDQDVVPNTRLYVNSNGLLTTTKSASTAIAGFFIEYRQKSITNARLLNITGTDRNFDTLIFYKTNADGYNTAETIAGIIDGELTVLTFAATSPTLEIGQVITNPAFTATYRGTPIVATLTDSDGYTSLDVSSTPNSFSASHPYSENINLGEVQFTLSISDSIRADSATASITWLPRVFYGVGADGYSSEAFIEALGGSELASSRNITFNVTPSASQRIYYAYPASYGAATISVGGMAGGFTLVSSAISITNSFGAVQDYRLYKSNQDGLGNTTVVVT